MSTFYLKKGSASYLKYGDSVLGVVFYPARELASLKSACQTGIEVSAIKIQVESVSQELNKEAIWDLRYEGVDVSDVCGIGFLTYKRESEFYDDGDKRVPNVVEISMDSSDWDVDVLAQSYLVSKHKSGVKLVAYEKEQLIGITLGINGGRINSKLIRELGFSEEAIRENLNIWMSLYGVRERRGGLTEVDKKNYQEAKDILRIEKINKVLKELLSTGISAKAVADIESLRRIFESVDAFSPAVLIPGKLQVYWDFDSYVHIVMRHLKDFQLGNFKSKTAFSYKLGDLKALMEKVLGRVESEIEDYLLSGRDGDFYREGRMAVFYNDDHYHFRINKEGRLIQFHAVGVGRMN